MSQKKQPVSISTPSTTEVSTNLELTRLRAAWREISARESLIALALEQGARWVLTLRARTAGRKPMFKRLPPKRAQ